MEDFVTFEIAKKLKNLGFEESTYHYYNIDDIRYCRDDYPSNHNGDPLREFEISAPTISQALKWLRDKFFLHISQKPYACKDGLMWMYEIRKFNKRIVLVIANKTGFVEEEEASLAGIEYVLDNLI